MPEQVKNLLHQMTQNMQVLLGSIELERYDQAMIAARDIGDLSDGLVDSMHNLIERKKSAA